ncbi:hypothetical protein HYH02_006416 [Chlamydomonas schloesseri]|uniref:Nephrocystin 3-like N-terminal domain-containing protein n=1 Tax=Chlamydomonas schloesseri TaxID=2026947 RepID=A0A835WJD1_9CHLO|nr:hypothetical protein HYH02_006416 [Chlamydomonas schloesseri]|eukprot:KAG2448525.1 hypothetical protein HYH02_006416 [Chlamydomonas schloesseri]
MGITLRGLRKLRTRLRLTFGEEYETMSTAEVNARWVKEVTRERQCRLLEVGHIMDAEDVAAPMYFISHAWKNKISLLLDFLLDRFLAAADGSVAVWLDILSVNQHESTSAHKRDIAAFDQVVKACTGGTIVVMDVANCNPATRGWCIYEWATTRARHGPDGLHMWLEPGDRGVVFGSLDIRKAECQFPEDKKMILATVERQHGSAEQFNTKLKLQLLLEPVSYRVDERRLLQRARGTRWDFNPVAAWLDAGPPGAGGGGGKGGGAKGGGGGTRVLCVVAGAGEGKSTISAALCAVPAEGGFGERISCRHYCKYSDQRRLDPVRVIKSLAFQLASRFPVACQLLLQQDAARVAQEVSAEAAFEGLLAEPLRRVVAQPGFDGQQVVLLLDALDEADPPPALLEAPAARIDPLTGRPATARPMSARSAVAAPPPPCSNKVVQLLTSLLVRLPPCVRFILTTRPDAVGGSVCGLLDRTFAATGGVQYVRPAALRRVTGGSAAAQAVGGCAAEGGILVYRTVVGECLPKGTVAALEAPPTLVDLDHVYKQVFAMAFAKLPKPEVAPVRTLLAVLLAAQEPLPQSLLTAMGLGGLLHKLPGYPVTFFAEEHHVYILHKSLADWLLDPWAMHGFKPDLMAGHRQLAQTLMLSVRKGGHPSPYTLKYLVRHLVACHDLPYLEALLLGPDFAFLAAAFSQGHGHGLLRDLLRLEAPSPPLADVQRWLLARQHELVAAKTEADVVATALRCPVDTLVYTAGSKRYKAMAGVAAEAKTGGGAPAAAATSGGPEGVVAPSQAWELVQGLGASRRWPATKVIMPGHSGVCACVSWSPDGATLASASWDGTLRLFDSGTGECIAVLLGHEGKAKCVEWSPSGRMLASGGEDKSMRLWDAVSGECVAALQGHEEDVNAVAWSADGKRIASGANDQTIRVWDVATASCTATLPAQGFKVNTVAWSRDGRRLASGGGYMGVEDTSVVVWDVAAARPEAVLVGHEMHVQHVAFSPDGAVLASASHDATVRLWSVPDAQLLAVLRHHAQPVTAVAWSGDGRQLATASWDKTLALVDLGSGQVAAILEGHMNLPFDCKWSPDNKSLASCGKSGTCRIWTVPELVTAPATASAGAGAQVAAVISSAEAGHSQAVLAVAWSPDGARLASASSDATSRVWEARSGVCLLRLEAGAAAEGGAEEQGTIRQTSVNSVAFSPDGQLLATGSNSKTVRLYAADSGALVAVLEGHQFFVQCVRFSPCGRYLASSGWDGLVLLWDVASGQQAAALEGHTDRVLGLAWSPDSRVLASCGFEEDRTVKLWAVEGRACMATLREHGAAVHAVAFSPDGRLLASCGGDGVRLYDAASRVCTARLQDFGAAVTDIAWSPNGDELACAADTGLCVDIRNVRKAGARVAVLQGPSAAVTGVAWSPDGRAVACCSKDKSIRVYERRD